MRNGLKSVSLQHQESNFADAIKLFNKLKEAVMRIFDADQDIINQCINNEINMESSSSQQIQSCCLFKDRQILIAKENIFLEQLISKLKQFSNRNKGMLKIQQKVEILADIMAGLDILKKRLRQFQYHTKYNSQIKFDDNQKFIMQQVEKFRFFLLNPSTLKKQPKQELNQKVNQNPYSMKDQPKLQKGAAIHHYTQYLGATLPNFVNNNLKFVGNHKESIQVATRLQKPSQEISKSRINMGDANLKESRKIGLKISKRFKYQPLLIRLQAAHRYLDKQKPADILKIQKSIQNYRNKKNLEVNVKDQNKLRSLNKSNNLNIRISSPSNKNQRASLEKSLRQSSKSIKIQKQSVDQRIDFDINIKEVAVNKQSQYQKRKIFKKQKYRKGTLRKVKLKSKLFEEQHNKSRKSQKKVPSSISIIIESENQQEKFQSKTNIECQSYQQTRAQSPNKKENYMRKQHGKNKSTNFHHQNFLRRNVSFSRQGELLQSILSQKNNELLCMRAESSKSVVTELYELSQQMKQQIYERFGQFYSVFYIEQQNIIGIMERKRRKLKQLYKMQVNASQPFIMPYSQDYRKVELIKRFERQFYFLTDEQWIKKNQGHFEGDELLQR